MAPHMSYLCFSKLLPGVVYTGNRVKIKASRGESCFLSLPESYRSGQELSWVKMEPQSGVVSEYLSSDLEPPLGPYSGFG